jgi:penicillin-binding protein 1A
MRRLQKILLWGLALAVVGGLAGALAIGIAYWLLAPRLPDVAEIRDVRLQVPLRVMSADGRLIAVFGETRRTPVRIADVPERVRQAFIAIEDARFYQHVGIDLIGIGRAVWLLATTDRERVPGGSTITQQVARNYFLSAEYSFTRKLSEIFLALKLERELEKDEILELYLNKIFFGHRAYGVVAAADFYYGKSLAELDLAEAAMLAAIPKFPSTANPLQNPERARVRRDYVLERMHEEGFIDAAERAAATAQSDHAHPHEPPVETEAPYIAEMIRQFALERLGNEALTAGYVVHATVESRLQDAANAAVRAGLTAYDRRHGYRGAEASVELDAAAGPQQWQAALASYRPIAGLLPGLVIEAGPERAQVALDDGQIAELDLTAVEWARPYLSENSRGPKPTRVDDVLGVGQIVRLARTESGGFSLAQLPKAQAALVGLSPRDGAIRALVGGYSFGLSKFNRAVQSNRQPGSSFKPFVYSAAFERGFTPASIVNDAPVVFPDPSNPEGIWKPSNDDEGFEGPMRLREAMVRSRNLVSVRLLDAIGVRFAHDYITRFGFAPDSLPRELSLALGSSAVAPLDLARGYAAFANGGYLIEPYFVRSIEDDRGNEVFRATPLAVCEDCAESTSAEVPRTQSAADLSALLGIGQAAAATPAVTTEATSTPGSLVTESPADAPSETRFAPAVLEPRNAYLVASLLSDVIRRGTGRGAMELGRKDLAGKTGTTNEHRDAWFSGFNRELVATTWMGLDDFSSLGKGEFAAQTALPIWIDFMRVALEGLPETEAPQPAGITTVDIDPVSGRLVAAGGGVRELLRVEDVSRLVAETAAAEGEASADRQATDIF